ncbi:MAG: flagellar biosynthetic protein FliO [Rhizobacter sp.]|nr:flagellar biosynthetic protein FliO [Rhizobacter sp.]
MTSTLGPQGTTAASATAAASGAEFGTAPALPFRRDDDPIFPVGGAVLLFGLMAVALWIVWWDRRRGGRLGRSPKSWSRLLTGRTTADSATQHISVLSTTRIDATTRVHVLAWQGRQLLVAVQAGQPPVVLDRQDTPATPSTGTSS